MAGSSYGSGSAGGGDVGPVTGRRPAPGEASGDEVPEHATFGNGTFANGVSGRGTPGNGIGMSGHGSLGGLAADLVRLLPPHLVTEEQTAAVLDRPAGGVEAVDRRFGDRAPLRGRRVPR